MYRARSKSEQRHPRRRGDMMPGQLQGFVEPGRLKAQKPPTATGDQTSTRLVVDAACLFVEGRSDQPSAELDIFGGWLSFDADPTSVLFVLPWPLRDSLMQLLRHGDLQRQRERWRRRCRQQLWINEVSFSFRLQRQSSSPEELSFTGFV